MSNHTPGPWSINEWPHTNADMSVGAIGTPKIAIIPLRDVSINEQKANTRLIAAAPDLLEACEDSLKIARAVCQKGHPTCNKCMCLMCIHERITNAIKKAKGE